MKKQAVETGLTLCAVTFLLGKCFTSKKSMAEHLGISYFSYWAEVLIATGGLRDDYGRGLAEMSDYRI